MKSHDLPVQFNFQSGVGNSKLDEHKEHRLSLRSGLTILWARQPAVLARRGYHLNTPSAWRHPSNNSPFPMTLAATPHYLSLEPGRNISLHACGTPLPLS